MFEGSEGPERAARGRYEQRQTRQVLSELFGTIRTILQRGATWQQRIGGDPLIPGHVVQRTNPLT